MPNTLSKENELQRKAFELYYGLGDKRSLRAVAETIGKNGENGSRLEQGF